MPGPSAPKVKKYCDECSASIPVMNQTGKCTRCYMRNYYHKDHPRPERQGFNLALRMQGKYVPGPRYDFCCGSCKTDYVTNLPIDKAICPYCLTRGVAKKPAAPVEASSAMMAGGG